MKSNFSLQSSIRINLSSMTSLGVGHNVVIKDLVVNFALGKTVHNF